jgi:hypothetical protein
MLKIITGGKTEAEEAVKHILTHKDCGTYIFIVDEPFTLHRFDDGVIDMGWTDERLNKEADYYFDVGSVMFYSDELALYDIFNDILHVGNNYIKEKDGVRYKVGAITGPFHGFNCKEFSKEIKEGGEFKGISYDTVGTLDITVPQMVLNVTSLWMAHKKFMKEKK